MMDSEMTVKAAIQVAANLQELSTLAAEQFMRSAVEAVREKGLFTVALAGSSTPRSLYTLLANDGEFIFSGETNGMFLRTILTATIAWQVRRCSRKCLFL
jgi:hypothetical protein